MSDFNFRQAAILRRLISEHRDGVLTLDSLVQRIEGVRDAIGRKEWSDAVYPTILVLEQVNAAVLNANRTLTDSEQAMIERSLTQLEAFISRFGAEGNTRADVN